MILSPSSIILASVAPLISLSTTFISRLWHRKSTTACGCVDLLMDLVFVSRQPIAGLPLSSEPILNFDPSNVMVPSGSKELPDPGSSKMPNTLRYWDTARRTSRVSCHRWPYWGRKLCCLRCVHLDCCLTSNLWFLSLSPESMAVGTPQRLMYCGR